MAELQTVGAAFDLAKLAWEGCKFLRKVKNADAIVGEAYERTLRLKKVLENVRLVLEAREERGVASNSAVEIQTAANIDHCVHAAREILLDVENRVGGFGQQGSTASLGERVKVAFRHPGVCRLQTDLEARVSALSADLAILQLSDQANTHATVQSNHVELVQTLDDLRKKLDASHDILRELNQGTVGASTGQSDAVRGTSSSRAEAIMSLVTSIEIGENLHERYTSEWAPDDRSLRYNRGLTGDIREDATPHVDFPEGDVADGDGRQGTNLSPSPPESAFDEWEEPPQHDTYPLEVLDRLIEAATDHGFQTRDQSQFNQAESSFQLAIRYSQDRERHYGVPFAEKVRLEEEVAQMYQKQGKHADAVAMLCRMLNESADEWMKARQNYLLASVYFDRHQSRNVAALSHSTADIDNAEGYARSAFSQQFRLLADAERRDAVERYIIYTELLIKILETRDRAIDANVLRSMLAEVDPSLASNSIRRSSTRTSAGYVLVGDRHSLLMMAIKVGDCDQVDNLLMEGDINIEQRCPKGYTALFAAVESTDETIVHKLLNPNVGAEVNTKARGGRTVLHHASALGLHDMVRCLLHHDADIEARDDRGHTPLMVAVQAGQTLVVQVLSNSNADIEAKNVDESSALHLAVRLENTDMLKQLLDLGPDLKDAVDLSGKTALHLCAELELVNQAKALLTHRYHVDVHAVDSCSRSALYLAASKPMTPKRESLVQLLVRQGAQIDPHRPPPRWKEYPSLAHFQVQRRPSRASTHASVSTEGTVGTVSTEQSVRSRVRSIFSRS